MKSSLLLPIIFSLFFSISQDAKASKIVTSGEIYGKWKITDIAGSQDIFEAKYLILKEDYTWFLLAEEKEFGFKDLQSGICSITENQISFDGNAFSFEIIGSNLQLENQYFTMNCILDETAPSESDWVRTVSQEQVIQAPIDELSDMAFDGTHIWYGSGFNASFLYKINPEKFNIDATLPINQSVYGIEWDGRYFWCSENESNYINQIDPLTGSIIKKSMDMGDWLDALAYDGQFLWCYSSTKHILYKYDISSNKIVSTINFNKILLNGVAFANGFLYVTCYDGIYKCSTNPFTVLESYYFTEPGGIIYDGNKFWISRFSNNAFEIVITDLK